VAADPGRGAALGGGRFGGAAAPPRPSRRPAGAGDLRARDRTAALRAPDAGRHDAAPARGTARPLRRGGRVPAGGQRRALRAARRDADGRAAARPAPRARGRPEPGRPPADLLGPSA
jgi:hypothetical protein